MALPSISSALRWRLVGPYRGGRAMAVAGHPTDSQTFYFGATGGGVWRTRDGGATWQPLSDDHFKRGSVGALALAPSAPHVIYVGMGECGMRADQTHGDGVYRSDDGGQTWRHLGLAATQNISRIVVHPQDPNTAYVSAFGHRFGPNAERGVYRTRDGGQSWQLVLHNGPDAGAIDLVLDPHDPLTLYVAFWEGRILPWGRIQRGPGSGILASRDGGDTWTDLTTAKGLPGGPLGKIGLAASPAQPGRLWALIDAEDGGLYRSDDAGASWTWLSADRNFLVRAWYFMHLTADPVSADTVYVVNRKLWKSVDGGRSFRQMNVPYVDQHALWVDASDPRRMILSNDGGVAVSFNGGDTWSTLLNQPTAEIYKIAADTHFPYRVYGAQQDNSTLCLPSRADRGPISHMDWYDVGGGESGFIAVRPDNPNIVYSSDLPGLGVTRYDHATHQIREIGPWLEGDGMQGEAVVHRFNWSVPVVLSPHDPDTLYVLGNRVYRSRDEGRTWLIVSPDLTRNAPEKLQGSSTGESSVPNDYCTISAFAESPLARGVLWAGTDDGLVQLSRDDGGVWADVTPPGLPAWSLTNVEASPHAAGGAYVAASAHGLDDFRPYVYKTTDYGRTWTTITAGLPADEFVRVVRADPDAPGVLYAGTEAGVYVSLDDGASWHALQGGLPHAPVHDLLVKDGDLVIGTHGRSMWILDDVTPLRQWAAVSPDAAVHLFAPRPVVRVTRQVLGLNSLNAAYEPFAAPNPASGVVATYHFATAPIEEVTLALLDASGEVLQSFTNRVAPAARAPIGPLDYHNPYGVAVLTAKPDDEPELGVTWGARTLPPGRGTVLPTAAGWNRWELPITYPEAQPVDGDSAGGVTGAVAVPGTYTVRLTVGAQVWTQPVELRPDPRLTTTPADYAAQFALIQQIKARVTDVHAAVERIRALRGQLAAWQTNAVAATHPDIAGAAAGLSAALFDVEAGLVQPKLTQRSGELESTHYPPCLNVKLATLGYGVARSDDAPTQAAYDLYADLSTRVDTRLERLRGLLDNDLAAFNRLTAGHPHVA